MKSSILLFVLLCVVVAAFVGCGRDNLTTAPPSEENPFVSFKLAKEVSLDHYRISIHGGESKALDGTHKVPYDQDLQILIWNSQDGVREIKVVAVANGREYVVQPTWIDANNVIHCKLTFEDLAIVGIPQQASADWVSPPIVFTPTGPISAASIFVNGNWEIWLAPSGNVWTANQDLVTGYPRHFSGTKVVGTDGSSTQFVVNGLTVGGVPMNKGTVVRNASGQLLSWTWDVISWTSDGKPVLSGESFEFGEIIFSVPPDTIEVVPGEVEEVDTYLEIKYLPEWGSVVLNGEDAMKFPLLVFLPNPTLGLPIVEVNYIWESNAGFKVSGVDKRYEYFLLKTADGRWIKSDDRDIKLTGVMLVTQPWGGADKWFYIDRSNEGSVQPQPDTTRAVAKLNLVGNRLVPDQAWVGQAYPSVVYWAEKSVAEANNLPSVVLQFDGVGYPRPVSNTADYYAFTFFKDLANGQRDWADLRLFMSSATITVGVDPNNPASGALLIKR